MRFAPGSTPPRLSDNLVTLVFSVSVGFVIADSTIRYYLKSATRERIGLYTSPLLVFVARKKEYLHLLFFVVTVFFTVYLPTL